MIRTSQTVLFRISSQNKHNFLIIGAPGIGKETSAKMLADDFCFNHISTSRKIIKNPKGNDKNLALSR
jgi:Holliday junction resolvasome RuvABC ATP-dependent DNA helicase subunit